MIDERADLLQTDNSRYPEMHWVSVKELLSGYLAEAKL
jgi:hypothetical protein